MKRVKLGHGDEDEEDLSESEKEMEVAGTGMDTLEDQFPPDIDIAEVEKLALQVLHGIE